MFTPCGLSHFCRYSESQDLVDVVTAALTETGTADSMDIVSSLV